MLQVVAAAFEASGCRVVGTATSGQAARTLGREAEVGESRTLASLLWRLDHDRLVLDDRTVVILDEVGMTDDAHLVRPHRPRRGGRRQTGARRRPPPAGRGRPGRGARRPGPPPPRRRSTTSSRTAASTIPANAAPWPSCATATSAEAVAWYDSQGRIHAVADRDDALQQAVDAWAADVAGRAPDRPVRLAAGQRGRPQPAGPGVDGQPPGGCPGRSWSAPAGPLPGRRPGRHPRPRTRRHAGHLRSGPPSRPSIRPSRR